MCKIYSQWELAVLYWELKPDTLLQPRRGGMGWEVGGRFKKKRTYVSLCHVDVWQKLTQYCKAIMLQLKFFKSVKNYVPDI